MSSPLHKTTGLAIHGATVALTPARAVTSHLRRHYHEHYRGRYRFAPVVFAFDLTVFGVAATLVAINIFLFVNVPPPAPSLGLVFSSAPLKSAAPQALVAEVQARGEASQGQVSLRWNLPAGTEILDAEPPLNSLGEASLGALKAGEKASSRLVVRFFAPIGAVRFGFQLTDSQHVLTGYENRFVFESALLLEPLFPDGKDGGAALSDERIPLRLSNLSNMRLESITLAGTDRTFVESLEPDQDLIVFAYTRHVTALMRAFPLVERDINFSEPNLSAKVRLQPSTGNKARLEADMAASGSVSVYHSGIALPHVRIFDVSSGRTSITIPLDKPADDKAWYAVADDVRGGYGQVAESRITTPFDVSAAIRYYATTGDQIGIGPIPPRVGEETKYWFQTSIGATTKDLSNIVLRIRLPAGVRLTGRDALPFGGGISESEGDVVWTLPYLPATGDGARVRFEIAFTPTSDMRGKAPLLIESVSARAVEVASGVQLEALIDGMDTSLPEDEKAKGNGIVQ